MDVESVIDSSSGRKISSTVTVHDADVALRLGFLRKVYGILTAQLILTIIVCITCQFSPMKELVQGSPLLLVGVFIGTIVTLVALIFKRHDSPINLYLLTAFTFLESISLGTIITFYDSSVVIKAFVITATVFIGLTAFTMQSKYDYSTWGAGLFSMLLILIMASFLQALFWTEAMEFVISVAGAVVFCGFILFDTHMIMHRLSTEEYIMAAVDLYLDLINLFIYMLRILQAFRNK